MSSSVPLNLLAPKPVGIKRIKVGPQGRVVIPSAFRGVFRTKRATFPVKVAFTLVGDGYATVQRTDFWPRESEKDIVKAVVDRARNVTPSDLPWKHLDTVQDFFRLVACRYIPGEIRLGWQMRIPAPVRAWLGLLPSEEPARSSARKPTKSRGKKDQSKGNLGGVIVIGTFGAIELWSETALSQTLAKGAKHFSSLATDAQQALADAAPKK